LDAAAALAFTAGFLVTSEGEVCNFVPAFGGVLWDAVAAMVLGELDREAGRLVLTAEWLAGAFRFVAFFVARFLAAGIGGSECGGLSRLSNGWRHVPRGE